MTTKLTHTARTILRSRVRRHSGNASVLNGRKVSDLSNADLLQAAMLLELDVPTDAQCRAYDEGKANGHAQPITDADECAAQRGEGGKGMAQLNVSPSGSTPAGSPDDDDKPSPDANDEADLLSSAPATPAPAKAGTADADADREKAAADLVASIRSKLGVGDFVGFNAALLDLARTALTPPPAPVVAIDPSKIEGHIPTVVGRKTARQLGINSTVKINDAATALDVYDYPDAPVVDPDYQWPDDAGVILSVLASGEHVFLHGPAGTGKSTLPKQLAALLKRPFVRVSCHEQTEAGALTGMTAPDPQEGAKWRDAQLAKAIRKPGTVILVDEPSAARPGAMFLFQSLLDDRVMYVEETGERIDVAPGVLFIFCDNTDGTGDQTGQYEGTRRMNRALLDRFAVSVPVGYLDPAKEIAALMAKTGCARSHATALVKFANLTRQRARDGIVSHGIGLRRLLSLARRIRDGADPHYAFSVCILAGVPFDDREPLRQLWTADVDTKVFA